MDVFYWLLPGITILFLFAGAFTSFLEKEKRAGTLLLLIAGIVSFLFLIPFIFQPESALYQWVLTVIFGVLLVMLFIPAGKPSFSNNFENLPGFHEEDAVLSRRLLQPGTSEYTSYYQRNPEKKEPDDKARVNPGLLSERARYYDPILFEGASANFTITDHLHLLESKTPNEKIQRVEDEKITAFIKSWLKRSGAADVGFAPLRAYHLYSHKGRGKRKGDPIMADLPHAIAITVEMNYEQMKYAPAGPTVLESSEQYLNSGMLASKLALMIKNLGYRARAHIDGNYELICPIVAEDAGLGVIGRMGLLMTPRLGPRVRIAVVTTDLPLKYKVRKASSVAIDFCRRCKKCAEVCPASAIPKGPIKELNGVWRWKIDSEKCYTYWTLSGTDCGRCMIVCPFAHQDSWFHRFIRWGIQNNLFFRIMAVKLDDVFYGRKPASKKLPNRLIFMKDK